MVNPVFWREHWPALLLALLFLLSLPALAFMDLSLDEAYYWQWAKNPQLSYFDHPPMVAWVMAASTALGGDSPLFVRLGGFVLLWSGYGFLFMALRKLFPEQGYKLPWLVLLGLNLTLVFAGAGGIVTIDTPLFAFWMGALYFGALVVVDGNARAWFGMGVCLGLGMLSKYTMVLLAPAMLMFLLFTPTQRHWLWRAEPWLAVLLALALFSPVLLWNWQHGWISFGFQIDNGLTPDENAMLDKLLGYLGEQAGVVNPLMFLLFLFYGGWGLKLAVQSGAEAYRYLAFLSWPVLMFFAFTSAVGEQAEANWPATTYPAGLALAFAVYQREFAARPLHRRTVAVFLSVSAVLMAALWLHMSTRILPIPPHMDRSKETHGWEQLGQRVQQIIDANPHPQGWFLMGDKATKVAEASFYSGQAYTAFKPGDPQRYLYLDDPNRTLKGRNAVVVCCVDQRLEREFVGYFRRFTRLEQFENRYKGDYDPKYSSWLYLGEDFQGNWTAFERLKASLEKRDLPGR